MTGWLIFFGVWLAIGAAVALPLGPILKRNTATQTRQPHQAQR